jgi:hypothetical protein
MIDISLETIGSHLEAMVRENLVTVFQYHGEKYFRIANFDQNQVLRSDRQPQTILKVELTSDCRSSWEFLATLLAGKDIATHVVVTDSQMDNTAGEFPAEVKRREEKLSNTGEAPKKIQTKNDVATVLATKYHFEPPNTINTHVSTVWQEKALRYAKALHLDLKEEVMARWMKMFKQAHEGRKSGNLDKAYSYLIDYEGNLNDEEKLKYFFHIYENGLKSYSI